MIFLCKSHSVPFWRSVAASCPIHPSHAPLLGGRLCGDLRLRFGRLSGRHAINALSPGLLRYQCQAELLAHHTRKEAADRVLLPAGRLHDGGDRCPLGLSKQSEDGLLLGPAAGRTQGNGRRLRRSVRAALGARNLGLSGGFAMRHLRILFGCDGTSAVTTEAPQWHHRQRGKIPDGPTGPYLGTATVTSNRRGSPLLSATKIKRQSPSVWHASLDSKVRIFPFRQGSRVSGGVIPCGENCRRFRWLGWRAPASVC